MLFQIGNMLIMSVFAFACLVPMLNILAKSLSSEAAVSMGRVSIFPIEPTLNAYKYITKTNIVRPFINQLIITLSGTVISIVILFLIAYPLSRPKLKGKGIIMMAVLFTMFFTPGIMPNYLLINALNLNNNLLSVILPGAFSGFNLMILRSYMQENIHEALIEAAEVEGASHTCILTRIIVPLCLPVTTTITLFVAVGYWNSYFDAMIYLTKPHNKTLQVYLQEVVNNVANIASSAAYDPDVTIAKSPQTIRSAAIIVTTLPVLVVYPLLQRYYIQGMTVGSVKG